MFLKIAKKDRRKNLGDFSAVDFCQIVKTEYGNFYKDRTRRTENP